MLPEYARQEFVPLPNGSNPLWLEKRERRKKILQYLSLALLLVLIAISIAVVQDYQNAKDPNASECKMGFVKTGCPDGFKCVGDIVKCVETGETYNYKLTAMIFPLKKCNAPEEYREFCVKANATDAKS